MSVSWTEGKDMQSHNVQMVLMWTYRYRHYVPPMCMCPSIDRILHLRERLQAMLLQRLGQLLVQEGRYSRTMRSTYRNRQ
jgi:hypothetical protein